MPLSRQRNLICLVTDRRRLSPENDGQASDRLVELAGEAAKAGVDLIQLRERDLEARDLTSLARRMVAAVDGTSTKIIVNDRADVALAAGAHGVHLRSDSIDAGSMRRLLPSDAIIGRSVHGPGDTADAARAGGLDYLILGTLFPTASKDVTRALTTIRELSAACAATSVPILAIGGLTLERAEEVAKAGAAGVAAIGLFLPPIGVPLGRHLSTHVTSLRRAFDTCGAVP
jgi:thiamine-phosphate diphosphorylase